MIPNLKRPEFRMAASAVIVLGLVGAWFIIDPLSIDSPGRAAEPPPAKTDETGCLLGMRDASVDLAPGFLKQLESAGVRVEPFAPATASEGGTTFTIPIRGASGVTCLARSGVIGFRGGMKFVGEKTTLTMRKWRLAVAAKRVETLLAAGNPVPIAGLRVDLEGADRVVRGQRLSLNADLDLGDGGLAALNLTFGTTFEAGERVGRVVLGVREIKPEPAPPRPPEPNRPAPTSPRVSVLG